MHRKFMDNKIDDYLNVKTSKNAMQVDIIRSLSYARDLHYIYGGNVDIIFLATLIYTDFISLESGESLETYFSQELINGSILGVDIPQSIFGEIKAVLVNVQNNTLNSIEDKVVFDSIMLGTILKRGLINVDYVSNQNKSNLVSTRNQSDFLKDLKDLVFKESRNTYMTEHSFVNLVKQYALRSINLRKAYSGKYIISLRCIVGALFILSVLIYSNADVILWENNKSLESVSIFGAIIKPLLKK